MYVLMNGTPNLCSPHPRHRPADRYIILLYLLDMTRCILMKYPRQVVLRTKESDWLFGKHGQLEIFFVPAQMLTQLESPAFVDIALQTASINNYYKASEVPMTKGLSNHYVRFFTSLQMNHLIQFIETKCKELGVDYQNQTTDLKLKPPTIHPRIRMDADDNVQCSILGDGMFALKRDAQLQQFGASLGAAMFELKYSQDLVTGEVDQEESKFFGKPIW